MAIMMVRTTNLTQTNHMSEHNKFPCSEEMLVRINLNKSLTERAEKLDEDLTEKFFNEMKKYPIDCLSPEGKPAMVCQGEMTVAGFDCAMKMLSDMSADDLKLIMATVLAFKVSDKYGDYLHMKGYR
jgi:hypothetical protein